jgi:spermidine synthase
MRGAGAGSTTAITTFAFFLPAAVLSAVNPAVIKLQLASLDETGTVVGRLSGISTAGALTGTFITGFVLVAAAPTRLVIRATAVCLIALGLVTLWRLKGAHRLTGGVAVFALVGSALSFAATHPCEHESAYYCAYVVADDQRPGGRALWLDTLRHSYVDLDDPTYLEFGYTRMFGDVIAAFRPDGEPVDALHVGGGGFTMPQYLRATRPGGHHLVLEVDPLLIALSEDELGLELRDDIEVVTGDARLSIRGAEPGRYDLVIGDAFGGVSVPWHLATIEFVRDLAATMTADGVYVANVIDYGPRDFLRAYVATIGAGFDHVAVLGLEERFGPRDQPAGGNVVVIASPSPLPLDAIAAANRARGGTETLLHGTELDRFVDGAPVLTDDDAPVDQLLTPLPTT